mmetsp:Transcript_16602/g.33605  ORF Transcript_16602/g.33605 Transcript_16602/m.33605 type:complete len:246 (-) Transcript_16602:287-1024(-)
MACVDGLRPQELVVHLLQAEEGHARGQVVQGMVAVAAWVEDPPVEESVVGPSQGPLAHEEAVQRLVPLRDEPVMLLVLGDHPQEGENDEVGRQPPRAQLPEECRRPPGQRGNARKQGGRREARQRHGAGLHRALHVLPVPHRGDLQDVRPAGHLRTIVDDGVGVDLPVSKAAVMFLVAGSVLPDVPEDQPGKQGREVELHGRVRGRLKVPGAEEAEVRHLVDQVLEGALVHRHRQYGESPQGLTK